MGVVTDPCPNHDVHLPNLWWQKEALRASTGTYWSPFGNALELPQADHKATDITYYFHITITWTMSIIQQIQHSNLKLCPMDFSSDIIFW